MRKHNNFIFTRHFPHPRFCKYNFSLKLKVFFLKDVLKGFPMKSIDKIIL